ncbi:MAG TPA: hypothetical protein VFD43_10980, partial [Planctomycetota bacterium]|nr:hypothetical protein [Planctomycetota bacterium]
DVPASNIARWDGRTWSALGAGIGGNFPHVRALAVFDDGRGAALYAGGGFSSAGSVHARHIARWDGTSWSALGSSLSGGYGGVEALAVFDDGQGPALFAGGGFTQAGGEPAALVARWDGANWS